MKKPPLTVFYGELAHRSTKAAWTRPLTGAVVALFAWGVIAPATANAQQEAVEPAPTLQCLSEPGERQHCAADTSAGVALVQEVGSAACLLGQSWGYDAEGVWVSDGCGGEFVLGQTEPPSAAREFLGHFEPYGQFLAHLAIYEGEAEVQDNASWLGMRFSTGEKVKFFAAVELGISLIQGPQFNVGATTRSGFLQIEEEVPAVFGNRLGYLGVDFGAGGRLALGKQNSAHYDIASYTTDRWNVFGGQASLAYPASTDGGETGTGRANRALTYRNSAFDRLDFTLQTSFRSADSGHFFDGFGVSSQLAVLPGLTIGASYTKSLLPEGTQEIVLGLDADNSDYVALGAKFSSPSLDLGAVFTTQKNGDFVHVFQEVTPVGIVTPQPVTVVFDGSGVELFAKAKFERFSILGGFVDYESRSDDLILPDDFRTRYGILGAELYLAKNGYAYTEWRIFDDSVNADKSTGFNVFTFGFFYHFSWNSTHDQ